MYSTFCYKSKRVLTKTFHILYKLCFCSDVLYHDVPSCDVSYRNVAMFPELLACEQACTQDKTAGNIVQKACVQKLRN